MSQAVVTFLSSLTWVSKTNCANCQGSMKKTLEIPKAIIVFLHGFLVLLKYTNSTLDEKLF